MSILRPFKGIRPTPELAERVAALPYDVMTSKEAREEVKGNPYSFLHVDRGEIDLPEGTDEHDGAVYLKAAENLNNMIEKGIFIQDKSPFLYIYRLTMEGRSQTGIVGCASIDEYLKNKIKKHENTLREKEIDRIKHVDTCNANTGPIFLTYSDKKDINKTVDEWTGSHSPVYDFVSDDKIGHTVWVIDSQAVIDTLVAEFSHINALYIADGHHRNASAVRVGVMRRNAKPGYTGEEEFNFYLSVFFPKSQLKILDYNRVVKDLNGLTEKEFLDRVSKTFKLEEYKGEGNLRPVEPLTYGMYLNKKWYLLKADGIDTTDPVKSLDVSILQNHLLSPVLGIKDPRFDKRIDFVGGIRGLGELEKRVDSGECAVAFSMYPTSIEQLMNVADNGLIMPPKSTWFEPKLRSGLFIHKLDD
ncbi:MAG: DUF1015 family protein [Clostridiales bacterium]|nr:DUF1015 family protein [Clostridiales bacterium]